MKILGAIIQTKAILSSSFMCFCLLCSAPVITFGSVGEYVKCCYQSGVGCSIVRDFHCTPLPFGLTMQSSVNSTF